MSQKTLSDHRKEALNELYAHLDKNVGEGAGRPLPTQGVLPLERISSGSVSVDHILGGGLPRGRVTIMVGPESGGKTTLATTFIAQAQKAGGIGAFIDAEHAFDPEWAKRLGVDIDTMLFHQPDTGEQALTVAEAMIKSGVVDILVVDSIAALVPQAELDGAMGESHMGLNARLMAQAMRKLIGAINVNNAAVIFINQVREKIGVTWGSSETMPGGRAVAHAGSIILDVRRAESIETGGEVVGIQVKLRTKKNKTAPPFRKTTVPLEFERGFDFAGELVDLGVPAGLLRKKGAWFYYGEESFQGREAMVTWLRAHPEVQAELRPKLLSHLQTGEVFGD